MGSVPMALLLTLSFGLFAYSIRRRWRLMMVGTSAGRFDQISLRVRLTWQYAIKQMRMGRYPLAGMAHMMIFSGFGVLLLRSVILWGRGFDAEFSFWLFGPEQMLGKVYGLAKDVFVLLVLTGTTVFFYYRVVKRSSRLTLNRDGIIVLVIITVMMVSDVLYDGAALEQRAREEAEQIVTRAREEVRVERDRAIQQLHEAFADLTIAASERVIGQSLDRSAHQRLIDEVLAGSSFDDGDNGAGAQPGQGDQG